MLKKNFFLLVAIIVFCGQVQAAPRIIDKPILRTEKRLQLIDEYTLKHYGKIFREIVPQAVVIHWTANNSAEETYRYFYSETRADGTLNVSSQFVVDRSGKIFRLTAETFFNRHVIGYNWCAIGIENVGGVNGEENLTRRQLRANVELIKYLRKKYPTIKYVFGHYQQDAARASGLYIEKVEGYRSIKIDPGEKFMKQLRKELSEKNLIWF